MPDFNYHEARLISSLQHAGEDLSIDTDQRDRFFDWLVDQIGKLIFPRISVAS